jgi:hypothetical protein
MEPAESKPKSLTARAIQRMGLIQFVLAASLFSSAHSLHFWQGWL